MYTTSWDAATRVPTVSYPRITSIAPIKYIPIYSILPIVKDIRLAKDESNLE